MPTRIKIILGALLLVLIGTGAFAALNTMTVPKNVASDQTEQSDSGSQSGSSIAGKDDSVSRDQDSSGQAEVSGAIDGRVKLVSLKNESTTGQKGSVQTFSILSQHVPKDGAKFILSSLQLSLADNYKPGTILSSDAKQVTTPSEGRYMAQSNGAIRFSPDDDFVGNAVGVGYSIVDTNGVTYGGSYSPSVTFSVTAAPSAPNNPMVPSDPVTPSNPEEPSGTCVDPGSQGIRLASKHSHTGGLDASTPLKHFDVGSGNYVMSDNGQRLFNIDFDQNIIRSTDAGESWERIGPDIEDVDNIDTFNIAASGDGMVVLLSLTRFNDDTFDYDRLDYRSVDGGNTWTAVNLPWLMDRNDGRVVMSRTGGVMYMLKFNYSTTQVDISVSTDKAQSWQALAPIEAYDPTSFDISDDGQTIAMSALDPATVYDEEPQSVIYVTTDGATTWTSSDPTTDYIGRGVVNVSGDGTKWSFVANDFVTYRQKLYTSGNGGTSWSAASIPATDLDLSATALARGSGKLFAWYYDEADNYRVRFFTSANLGSSWSEVMTQSEVLADWFNVSSDGSILRTGGNYQPYVSTDSGVSWLPMPMPGLQFDAERVDLDPSTPVADHVLDKTSTEGWKLTYTPELDDLYFEVTDDIRITRPYMVNLKYTLTHVDGCATPVEGELTYLLYQYSGD